MRKSYLFAAALLFPLAGCMVPAPAAPASQSPLAAPSEDEGGHKVVFEVTSADGKISTINWSTLGDSAIDSNQKSPYKKTVTLKTSTGIVGVNASDSSRLACRLTVDGKVVDTGESDAVVNCSATIS